MHAQHLSTVGSPSTLARDVDDYLISKRRRLTDASYREYSRTLRLLLADHPGLTLEDFQLPRGTLLVEDFMNRRWGNLAPRTFNKNLTTCRNFFEWAVKRGRLHGDPTLPIERAKPRPPRRKTLTEDQCDLILASNRDPRDQIALRLLLYYGIRKGALAGICFEHFDRERQRVEIFTKGQKIQQIPIGASGQVIWDCIDRLVVAGVQPNHYLLPRRRIATRAAEGQRRLAELETHLAKIEEESRDFPVDLVAELDAQLAPVLRTLRIATLPEVRVVSQDDAMPLGEHGLHDWWYRCLERAGVVLHGATSGQKMHSARHTAAQRILDSSGNIRAAQSLLGHTSIAVTEMYTEFGEDRLDETLQNAIGKLR